MIMDQWHCQPSEFDRMPYYRIEYMEEDLKDLLEAKSKGATDNSGEDQQTAYSNMIKSQQSQMMKGLPKMPTGFSMPSFKLPK